MDIFESFSYERKDTIANIMTTKPIYEVVKVVGNKVFIVGLGDPCITDALESVYEELNKIFPNKRIIFIDDISDSLEWWEIMENVSIKDESSFTGYEILFGQYNEEVPNIKTWDKILDKILKPIDPF